MEYKVWLVPLQGKHPSSNRLGSTLTPTPTPESVAGMCSEAGALLLCVQSPVQIMVSIIQDGELIRESSFWFF